MEGAIAEALESLSSAVDVLLSADRTVLAGGEVLVEVGAVETVRRKLEALSYLQIAEIEQRGLAHEQARTSTADLLVQLLRLAPGEAKTRVARAGELGPRRDFVGAPLEPIFPRVADAMGDGAINSGHVAVIVDCLDAIPAHVAHEVVPAAEQFLVEHARQLNPKSLRVLATRLLATVDPDGAEPREDEIQRRRGFTIGHRGGILSAHGQLTGECAAVLSTVLDSLSRPQPSEDGIGDDRTPAQRRHDALLDLGQRLLRSATLPDAGGVPVTVVVTMTESALRTGRGTATTEHGDALDAATALRLAGEADIIPVLLDNCGAVTGYGRTRRLASAAQRRALAARDGGCSFPGCTRPASWCQTNHIIRWEHGGPTDLANLHLLCGFHHREFAKRGWAVHMRDGTPEWIPPAWLDPTRTPVRNTAHHLPDFTFEPV